MENMKILAVWHKTTFCDNKKLESRISSSQRALLVTEMMVAFQRGYCRQNWVYIITDAYVLVIALTLCQSPEGKANDRNVPCL